MSIVDPFTSFDPTPYQSAPQLPLQTLVVLSNALYTRLPQPAPSHVKKGAEDMRTAAKEAGKAMVVRLRETNEVNLAADVNLDNAMDGLFRLVFDGLRNRRIYQRPGLDFLLKDADWQDRIKKQREQAQIASLLFTKLFGDGNLDMLMREFPEQSQLMTNVIALIELQRRIVSYASLVLTMLKEDKPATLTIVETALRPMVTMRVTRNSNTPTSPESQQDADLLADPEADLQTVLAQAQADLDQEG